MSTSVLVKIIYTYLLIFQVPSKIRQSLNKIMRSSNHMDIEKNTSGGNYLLACKSWEPYETISDIGFYSEALWRRQAKQRTRSCKTEDNRNKRRKEVYSRCTCYFLSCTSWEPHEKFTGIVFLLHYSAMEKRNNRDKYNL